MIGKLFTRVCRQYHSKVVASAAEAVKDIKDGSEIAVGGFGLCGNPLNLIEAVFDKQVKDLVLISNDSGTQREGLGILFRNGQVKKMFLSYAGENKFSSSAFLNGALELIFTPQGTLAEQLRAGSAGIPAFYTPTGYGTPIQTGDYPAKMKPGGVGVERYKKKKEVREFDGRWYVLEKALRPQFALVKAYKCDTIGNAVFKKTARNFNPDMAAAAKCTILEAEEIVAPGDLDPNHIHLPHIFVHKIVQSEGHKSIQVLKQRKPGEKIEITGTPSQQKNKERIARRGALLIQDNMNVNLGIGIPTLIANFIDPTYTIFLESENGLLGMGPFPEEGEQDPDLINAGKQTITAIRGASYFSSSDSFRMIRGGHINYTFLGGLQVSQRGDLANWSVPGKFVKGMGGAMDLVASGSKVVVCMEHLNKGSKKFVKECNLPLTGKGVVSGLITEMGYWSFDHQEDTTIATLEEYGEGFDVESIRAATEAEFEVSANLRPMKQ